MSKRHTVIRRIFSYTFHSGFDYCERCSFPLQLSQDQGLTKTCAFKEFRFEPPYASAERKKKKKLPPIPEHILPKRHNSFEEEPDDELPAIPPVPSLTISPAFFNEKVSFFLHLSRTLWKGL